MRQLTKIGWFWALFIKQQYQLDLAEWTRMNLESQTLGQDSNNCTAPAEPLHPSMDSWQCRFFPGRGTTDPFVDSCLTPKKAPYWVGRCPKIWSPTAGTDRWGNTWIALCPVQVCFWRCPQPAARVALRTAERWWRRSEPCAKWRWWRRQRVDRPGRVCHVGLGTVGDHEFTRWEFKSVTIWKWKYCIDLMLTNEKLDKYNNFTVFAMG